MIDKNDELFDEQYEEYENDLAFIKEQLDLFGKEIEIPSSIYSTNLMHLLDEVKQDEQVDADNVIKLKPNVWKRPLTYAAMFAIIFGVYYMSGIKNVPEITNQPAPMMATEGASPRSVNVVTDDVYATDYKQLRLAIGEIYKEQESMRSKYDGSAVSSSASAAPAPAAPAPNGGGEMGGAGGGADIAAGSNAESSKDVSSTNTQVDGIDEADIVKTDGKNLYVYSRDTNTQSAQVAIVEAETMIKVSSIDLKDDKGSYGYGDMEMYLVEDRLVLLNSAVERVIPLAKEILFKPLSDVTGRLFGEYNKSSASGQSPIGFAPSRMEESRVMEDYYGPNYSQVASAVIYDVSDNKNPKEVRRFEQDGDYVSSRVYDGVLYMVTSKRTDADVRDDKATLKNLVPVIGDSVSGTTEPIPAQSVVMMPAIYTPIYAVVSAVDIKSDTTPATTKAVLGGANEVYMSEENIYVTSNTNSSMYSPQRRTPETNIIKMSVDGLKIEYKASSAVDGYIDNQFSLDEHKGNFRIATTSYENSTTQNNLYVLDENLKQVGEIEGLAPGERIYSVRYMGDMAYVVTFKQVDPLFAIDLSDPKNPKVLGELKIPGFSEYMHPIGDNTLIGFGINTEITKEGNVLNDGIKLSMFDVSDPMNPKESNVFYLGNRGTQSEVLYNHKAFLYSDSRDLIGFPITIQTEISDSSVKDIWSRQYKTSFSGYMLMGVDKDKGFKILASIPSENTNSTWYMDEGSIRRGVYIDNKLYTVSFDKVMEYSLDTYEKLREAKI